LKGSRRTWHFAWIAHCELKIGDSTLNLGTSMEGWPAHGLVAQIYVEDSDVLFQRAVQAGAKVIMPMTNLFFGSHEGRIADPFGNVWTIAILKEEVAPGDAATDEGRGLLSTTCPEPSKTLRHFCRLTASDCPCSGALEKEQETARLSESAATAKIARLWIAIRANALSPMRESLGSYR
jgi:hypothetical protein